MIHLLQLWIVCFRRIKFQIKKSGRKMVMFISRLCRPSRGVSLGFTLWLLLLPVGLIQIAAAQAEGDEQKEPVEEITVYGHKPLSAFRVEMVAAENKVYDLYNVLNDDDEFDVICERDYVYGSHIKIRRCRGRFEMEGLSELDQNRLRLGFLPHDHVEEVLRKKKIVFDKMDKLAEEHPDLRESVFELYRMTQAYKAEKKLRCDGRLICDGSDNSD